MSRGLVPASRGHCGSGLRASPFIIQDSRSSCVPSHLESLFPSFCHISLALPPPLLFLRARRSHQPGQAPCFRVRCLATGIPFHVEGNICTCLTPGGGYQEGQNPATANTPNTDHPRMWKAALTHRVVLVCAHPEVVTSCELDMASKTFFGGGPWAINWGGRKEKSVPPARMRTTAQPQEVTPLFHASCHQWGWANRMETNQAANEAEFQSSHFCWAEQPVDKAQVTAEVSS